MIKLNDEAVEAALDVLFDHGHNGIKCYDPRPGLDATVREALEAALVHLTDDGATDTPPPVAAGAESATSTAAPSSPHPCDHSESLYGRCTSCGKTWETQAKEHRTREALRDQIIGALRKEGAYCGDCDFEDDWRRCVGCRGVLGDYADAVLKLIGQAQ